ncbi:hypothetical protein BCSAG_34190 [Bacillus cereus]
MGVVQYYIQKKVTENKQYVILVIGVNYSNILIVTAKMLDNILLKNITYPD